MSRVRVIDSTFQLRGCQQLRPLDTEDKDKVFAPTGKYHVEITTVQIEKVKYIYYPWYRTVETTFPKGIDKDVKTEIIPQVDSIY